MTLKILIPWNFPNNSFVQPSTWLKMLKFVFFHSSEQCFLFNSNLWPSFTQQLTSGHYFFYCFPPPVVRWTVLLSKTLDRWTGLYNPRWVPVEANWMLSFHAKTKYPKTCQQWSCPPCWFPKKCTFIICGTFNKTNLECISDYGWWYSEYL